MKRSTAVFLTVLVSILVGQVAEARYKLEVRVYRFSNLGREDWDGGNCDIDGSVCEVFFLFCLRPINWQIINSLCPWGSFNTESHPIGASSRTFTIGQNIAGSVPNPVVFTSTDPWPGQFQLMVRLDDSDGIDSNDLIDRVPANLTLATSDTFTSRQLYNGLYNRASVELSFRAMCQTNYYGSDCTALCIARDDSQGHYTCADDGNIVCLSGYTDTSSSCTVPVCTEECVEGDCTAPGECTCFSGWTGDLCDQCVPAANCMNGYCSAPGECICNEGYSGALCQIDDDVCGHQAPCQNGGMCANNGPDDYTCTCPAGFSGADCEEDINECDNSPCENGATCTNTLGSYNCTCAVGWTGDTCGDNIDECSSNPPCQNGATCIDCVPTGPGFVIDPSNPTQQQPCPLGYTCTCPGGFHGDNCETDTDYCRLLTPCANGSTCHDVVGGPGYTCECAAGFTGQNCTIEIDECDPNPCQNGGSCTDDIGSYTCQCAEGFTGNDCHINIDDCVNNTCSANNTHECLDGVNSYSCVCVSGYTGEYCDTEIDLCDGDPCFNGATCNTLFNDFTCECPSGFIGAQCGINIDDCHPDLCLNGGTCVDGVDDYSCTCLPQYTGDQCENDVPIETCDDKPCKEGTQFCVPLLNGGFTCEPCVDGEAGCSKPGGVLDPDQQIGNGTTTDSTSRNTLIGGIVGGVVGAIVLLLLLILLLVCCVKYCACCGACCTRTKEEEADVRYHNWSGNEVQDNPLYFGTSTILSSQSGTMGSTTRGTMPRYDADNPAYRQDSTDSKTDSLQNPMYAIAQEQIQRNAHPPNLPPPRNASESLSSGSSGSFSNAPLLPPPVPNASDGHYEQIAPRNPPAVEQNALKASGVYNRLKAEPSPSPEPENLVSGKYDRLTIPQRPPTENPYIVEPREDENPYTSTTRQAGRHKDMYSMLPSPAELNHDLAGTDSEMKKDVKESQLPPKTQNPYEM